MEKNTKKVVSDDTTAAATQPAVEVSDPTPAELLTKSKFTDYYTEKGYALTDFISRSREEAKNFCASQRDSGYLAALVALRNGFYGVFAMPAPERVSKAAAAKPTRSYPELPFETPSGEKLHFSTTKEARAFAGLLIEAARQAEFDADREAALASKATRS